MAKFERDRPGNRLSFAGMDLVHPVDAIPNGRSPFCQNVRAYWKNAITGRNRLTAPVEVPQQASAAVSTGTVSQTGSGVAWTDPDNIVAQGSYANIALQASGTDASDAATGSTSGGGVAWSNPTNIDNQFSSFASVSLSAGGGYNYSPSQPSGGATATATVSTPSDTNSTALTGFSSVAASSSTLYITVAGTASGGNGNVQMQLQYSINNGSSWTTAHTWLGQFSTTTIPIAVTGITNLNTVQIQVVATANLISGNGISCTIVVSNWYATVSGASQPTSQTLAAAVSGLSIPSGATITGIGISFQGNYSGALPALTVSLNVGTQVIAVTLPSALEPVAIGGQGVLWGYPSWTSATLSSLAVKFNASTASASSLQLNSLNVTVYYSESSELLKVTGLAFAIPVGATITGISVTFQAQSSIGNALSINVQALQNGSVAGNTVVQLLQTGPSTYVLGGTSFLWGYAWNPVLINGANGLGVAVQAVGSGTALISAGVNSLVITVYYTQQAPLILPSPAHTIQRLNDSTPSGPPSGSTLIVGAGNNLYNQLQQVGTGFSGNPMSIVPFRPNTSPQPWAYGADNSESVTLQTTSLYSGAPVSFPCFGMVKVRSDGLAYKDGVKEPQTAPLVGTQNTSVVVTGALLATAIPWTNYNGANSDYDYGETNGYPNPVTPDGTAPFVIAVDNATSVTIQITGTAAINGASGVAPTANGPSTGVATNPGHYVQEEGTGTTPPAAASVVIGAFTDGNGNVVGLGAAPSWVSSVVDVGGGLGTAFPVPFNAVAFQLGINSTGNTFSANSGQFILTATVTTDALPPNLATIGTLTAYVFPDSPVIGPVGVYIWKSPSDPSGSGPIRTSTSATITTTGNSFIFDCNFGTSAVPAQAAGIPGLPGLDMYSTAPSDTTVPMVWTTLNPQSVDIGSEAVYQPALKGVDGNTAYQNFNFCLVGTIYVPQGGEYTFILSYKDDVIWGIGGGASVISSTGARLEYASGNPPTLSSTTTESTSVSDAGQSVTVINGLPLLPRVTATYSSHGLGGVESVATVVVSFPNAGTYPIEIDYDFWYHSGRVLLLQASPTPGAGATIIPPLPANVRQDVQYRYVYRSSATGAPSNPSPESTAISLPVTASTVTSVWSDDPQVDVVDYYRIDSTTANFTYVATGPNDNSGNGTNTPIVDSLTDLELGDQLLSYDNFEPFPSIDLPQKGVCNVSGGVITWVSGGSIGGSSQGFNTRWLAGTTILIGSPTSLAYVLIARPTSNNTMTIPEVPDGTNLAYEITEPILAAQPLPYTFGPTDNINFAYAVGDPLRPGTLYWCSGSNLDVAPDTNQLDVTDPGEPLVNGAISGGRGVLFSIRRAWLIMPNFYQALATVTGVEGSTWTLQESSIDRGLFMPRCVAINGGGIIFFRVNDGIHISPGGLESKSITDEDLYPLFPHESADGGTSIPEPVTIAGNTVYPPNDALPQSQRFNVVGAYLYYDYIGTDNNNHTLVYDIAAQGWVWDLYEWPTTLHAPDEDISTTGTLVGCTDGSVRQFATGSTGVEVATAVYLTPAVDFGDTRNVKKVGDLYMESESP